MATTLSKYGKVYDEPDGLSENKYYEIIDVFIDLVKIKGLTVRQAQKLFIDCADAVLSTKL